jgi:hypothetical protein
MNYRSPARMRRSACEEVVSDLQTELESRGVSATTQVLHCDPATAIIAVAQHVTPVVIVSGHAA